MTAASPALQAREQLAMARSADALAALLAAETGAPADDLGPLVAANALIGVQRALVDHTRRRVLADEEPARLAADLRGIAERSFARLERGLGDYAPNRRPRACERRAPPTGGTRPCPGSSGATRRPLAAGARTRKGVLVVHIASAGAWLGVDVVMAVLVFTALASDDGHTKALSFRALIAVGPLLACGLSACSAGSCSG